MSEIKLFDLQTQQGPIRERIERRIAAVLAHGAYVNGPEIAELEAALRERTGAADVIGVSSGTDALVIALMAEGVGPGDAVLVPGFTYMATVNAVLMVGATPVFVDVAEDSYNMDPAHLRHQLEHWKGAPPKAIIAVDLYGLPARYDELNEIAGEHGLVLMADAAQSFGGRVGEDHVGNLCDITTTSFFPTKTLGGYGDGGAIFTRKPELSDICRSIRQHGTAGGAMESVRVGMNGRLDTIQAAVLLTKLEIFDEELAARERIAGLYDSLMPEGVVRPPRRQDARSAWALYSIQVEGRDRVREALAKDGIPTGIYYPMPLHQHGAFNLHAPEGGLPVSEKVSARILSLPFHPYLTDAQAERVADALAQAL